MAATLIVADLHLEKGTSYATRGVLLPPYDTRTTLARLAEAIGPRVRRVICLGDSFHDGDGPERLSPADTATLHTLVERHDWIWIAGNHDPVLPAMLGGRTVVGELRNSTLWCCATKRKPAPPARLAAIIIRNRISMCAAGA